MALHCLTCLSLTFYPQSIEQQKLEQLKGPGQVFIQRELYESNPKSLDRCKKAMEVNFMIYIFFNEWLQTKHEVLC